jgi:hypothetical protein
MPPGLSISLSTPPYVRAYAHDPMLAPCYYYPTTANVSDTINIVTAVFHRVLKTI